MKTEQLLSFLKKEKIRTWFDLGLFLDRLKEEQTYPSFSFQGSYDDFKEYIRNGGIAFLTFHYMVDGVTVEVEKYASLIRRNIPGIPVHYIAGSFQTKSASLFNSDCHVHTIPELSGFNDWELYKDFYFTSLERGSETYNELIGKLWVQTLDIIEKLGKYLEKERINLLYLINVCSNPGNVAFALATILISELLKIPVINNNHDFYWEGGRCNAERARLKLKTGPRDLFFKNYHLGEFFSIIQTLYPWQSRTWINVNINRDQTEHLIKTNGQNPANVMEIGTAVDTGLFTKNDKRKNINTFIQFEKILSRYRQQLISYSVEDVLEGNLVAENNTKPILIGTQTRTVKRFISENIIFLQPTRIISRKRIETSFGLLQKMLEDKEMQLRFSNTPQLKLTLLITGPIAAGHYGYYQMLIRRFQTLLNLAGSEFKDRIYLAFLFGELDKESFKKRFESPVGIPELYNISSLILLPSKTEGRGLPIIEATACGTPIFCRRYEPESVYSDVIGEHLSEKNRLRVLEFRGKKINNTIVQQIIDRVFFPHRYTDEFKHNKRVVNKRYSLDALNDNIYKILHQLYMQLTSNEKNLMIVRESMKDYRKMIHFSNDDLKSLLDTSQRHYLPGYGRMKFMNMLKSLIDPSYFRVEQQLIRGMAFHFAGSILENDPDAAFLPEIKINNFFNAVETLFNTREGELEIQHDHSMSYRHRNKNYYHYQDLTFQELTGLINLLYLRIVQPSPLNKIDLSPQFFTDWDLALQQLTGSSYLAIDDRKLLIEKLQDNHPIAYFPGAYIMYELEFFALQSIRSRLKLPIEHSITRDLLNRKAKELQSVFIFAQEKNLGKQLNKDEITDFIVNGKSEELKLLYEYKVIQIVRTKQVCVGIHFPQLGSQALKTLRRIKELNGYILTNRSNAALMTDIVDMERFHIGHVSSEQISNIMGIPMGSGYIQYVPAGIRVTLAYPSPVQTAKDFDIAMKSDLFKSLVKNKGYKNVIKAIKEDAIASGSPVNHVLQMLNKVPGETEEISYRYISGIYTDGMPYNGVLAELNFRNYRWNFAVVSSRNKPKTVLQFARSFNRNTEKAAMISWNGGYILNPELVGKLGIPESYIGSPLGLLISDGKVLSPPLFNKPALMIMRDGSLNIKRVSTSGGIGISWRRWHIELPSESRNNHDPRVPVSYYDLFHSYDHIPGNDRIIVRLAGNVVKEIIHTSHGDVVPVIPVGLTLSFRKEIIPQGLKEGDKLELSFPWSGDIIHAVEAGPLLLENGKIIINMDSGGWKTTHSIKTQAARLDYTDMRGPKIAVGLNREGRMMVLTINGRIRESVGATHHDMAKILKNNGMEKAMGFDPGGSSTLVVRDKILNISPYNTNYESNVYALPPEPRAVSNAIIGFIE